MAGSTEGQETPAVASGSGLWEKRVAPDTGAGLALLSAGLQNCRVISSKGGHDLHVPLPLPALLYRGPVDLPEC